MTNPYPVTAVVAMARNRVIGDGEKLLWHLPGDLPRVKVLTMGRPLIMGRRTYLSIGRPLPGRATIVLTRQSDWSEDGVMTATSLDQAIEMAAAWIDEDDSREKEIIIFVRALTVSVCRRGANCKIQKRHFLPTFFLFFLFFLMLKFFLLLANFLTFYS